MGRKIKDESRRVGFVMDDENWTFLKYYMYISGLSLTEAMNRIVKDYRKSIEETESTETEDDRTA